MIIRIPNIEFTVGSDQLNEHNGDSIQQENRRIREERRMIAPLCSVAVGGGAAGYGGVTAVGSSVLFGGGAALGGVVVVARLLPLHIQITELSAMNISSIAKPEKK